MATKANKLNQAYKGQSFHVLFLSEGFGSELIERKNFNNFCKLVMERFFEISPFDNTKKYIGIWSSFVSSNFNGLPEGNSNDTPFLFYKSNGKLIAHRDTPIKIAEHIKGLEIVQPFTGVSQPISGTDIWLNPNTKGHRLVCVIVKDYLKLYTSEFLRDHIEYQIGPFPSGTKELFPYIAISMWPFQADFSSEYENPAYAVAYLLAQQVGLALNLGPEYEKNDEPDKSFREYVEGYITFPNLVASSTLFQDSKIEKGRIPWIDDITDLYEKIIDRYSHPSENDENAFSSIRSKIVNDNKLIVLDHPNPNSKNELRYIEGVNSLVNLPESPNLIEGGGLYRKNVFRPSVECLMRFEMANIEKANKKKAKGIPYCKVCRGHINGILGDSRSFVFKGVRFIPVDHIGTQPIESRAAIRFVENINDLEKKADTKISGRSPELACVAASFRRFESFFFNVLKWKHGETSTTVDNPDVWKEEGIKYPASARFKFEKNGRLLPHYLWINSLHNQQSRKDVVVGSGNFGDYAAMGAAGVLPLLGFGKIANKLAFYVEGDSAFYYQAEERSYEELQHDLDNIQAGALLQLYPNWKTYRDCVRYVFKALTATELVNNAKSYLPNDWPSLPDWQPMLDENGNPRILGHSVIYMGKENGKYLVADQEKLNGVLTENWRKHFKFWLAAQWYDAEDVPQKKKND